ncbi:MAG: tRNA (cytidine(34)-2'-O)-methyltransferase [Clostridiales bacterium]|nr:tRNA (cytidine(34)-2'-O)-methyltransferase [Clostridiales bacterium]
MMIHVVLVEPEIPQNTGNIARTCAALGARLHLVEPLGFIIDDKHVKRAGLDYWHLVEVETHPSFEDVKAKYPGFQYYYSTTKAPHRYDEVKYPEDVFIVFGKETKGLGEGLLKENLEDCIRIPMREEARSLNLSNAVAIVVYEAMRQQDFKGLLQEASYFG